MNLPVVKEGLYVIVPFLILLLLLLIFSQNYFAIIPVFLITLFLIYFFRDPLRMPPGENNLVVAPADGKVIKLEKVYEGKYLKGDAMMVRIFMSLFSVHINRVPVSGEVERIDYNKGKFLAAFKEKASFDNEQNTVVIKAGGRKVVVRQIAGLIARRIICWLSNGQKVAAGEKLGLICFGSRADLFIPGQIEIKVKLGENVKGGETTIGVLK